MSRNCFKFYHFSCKFSSFFKKFCFFIIQSDVIHKYSPFWSKFRLNSRIEGLKFCYSFLICSKLWGEVPNSSWNCPKAFEASTDHKTFVASALVSSVLVVIAKLSIFPKHKWLYHHPSTWAKDKTPTRKCDYIFHHPCLLSAMMCKTNFHIIFNLLSCNFSPESLLIDINYKLDFNLLKFSR